MITTAILGFLTGWAVISVPVSILVGRGIRDLNDRVLVLEGETVLEPQAVEESAFRLDFFAPTGTDPR